MSSLTNEQAAKRKETILNLAMGEGSKWGITGFIVAGAATALATMKSKKFDKMTSVSAKASIPVMAGLGLWSFKYEITAHDAQLRPEKYGLIALDPNAPHKFISKMPWHHKAINYVYDHPFQMIATMAAPLVGSIMYTQSHNTHLTFSQKIMHSRVFAQAGVLSILLTTMAFREYMDRKGRYEGPGVERHGIAPSYVQHENSVLSSGKK